MKHRPGLSGTLLLLSFLLLLVAPIDVGAQGYRTLIPEPGTAAHGGRVALVIGNSAYEHARPLLNPGNDARDVAQALRGLGFTVVTGTDLSQEEMERAVDTFATESHEADVAMVFYAGHGVEVDGENYLIPVSARIEAQTDVKYRAISASWVLERMNEAAGDGLALLVLDACRDNPFRSWRSSGGGGLSAMNGPSGSIIAYATSPGNVASDNEQRRNGLYTQMLLEEIARPGVEVSRMLRRVGARVAEASAGEQQPWMAASYVNRFYFLPGDETSGSPTPPPSADAPARTSEGLFQQGRAALIQGDLPNAFEAFVAAANQEHVAAMAHLAEAYFRGLGVAIDYQQAHRWALAAAERGDPNAQYILANLYLPGHSIPVDLEVSNRWSKQSRSGLLALAEAGDPVAQANLAEMHQLGIGVSVDAFRAVPWYEKSAAQGYVLGLTGLAYNCIHSFGGAQGGPAKGARLHRQAARTGLPLAQYYLGRVFEKGRGGIPEDAAEASRWYRRAAEQGLPSAQYALARMYKYGDGVDNDFGQALYWYQEAAKRGHYLSQYEVGVFYNAGRGVPVDYAQAARWYRMAAVQGYGFAMVKLADLYAEGGPGLPRDIAEAVRWYRQAVARSDSDHARKRLAELGY